MCDYICIDKKESESMFDQPSYDDNSGTTQALVLFGIIALLGILIFTASPNGARELVTDFEPDVISNPQIDESEMESANQAVMPIAMFNLENPNGWESPDTVTLVGTFQSELNCESDTDIDCQASQMSYDILGDIWKASFDLPAGDYSYHAYLDESDHVYGKNGIAGEDSPPIELTLNRNRTVNFYYDHKTGWITDDINSLILTMPSNFQDDVGCIEEWNAGCFRTWMQDVDGDGIYTYETLLVPGGSWEARVAINGNLDNSYGQGGELNSDNFPLWIPNIGHLSVFAWDSNLNEFTPFISQIPLRLSDDLPSVAPNQ